MHMRLSRFLYTEYGSTQRGLIPKRESRFSAAMFRFQARWLSQFGATMLEHFGDLNSDGWTTKASRESWECHAVTWSRSEFQVIPRPRGGS